MNAPFFVSEEFAFEKRFGQSTAVNGNQRMKFSRTGLMDRARHQFLAGPTLSRNQHRSVRGTNGFDGVENLAHGAALADHFSRPRHFRYGLTQEDVLLRRPLMFQSFFHEVRNLVRIEGLGHIVISSVLQRRDGSFD